MPSAPTASAKARGSGSMCGSGFAWSEMVVDVEEDRAGQVRLLELGARVALEVRQVEGGVHHLEVGLAQVGGQPLGADQRILRERRHRLPPGFAGSRGQELVRAHPALVERFFPAEVGLHRGAPALVGLLHDVVRLVEHAAGPVSTGSPAAFQAASPPSSTRAAA